MLKYGAAAPHSKTQARNVCLQSRRRFGVQECSAALQCPPSHYHFATDIVISDCDFEIAI